MNNDLTPLNSSAKENTITASAPTISNTGPKKLKNDTGSTLINANPERMDAKNNKINSIVSSPPFTVEYVFIGDGDWIITKILQKNRPKMVCFVRVNY